MTNKEDYIKYGSIYWFRPSPHSGDTKGNRPCIVFSKDSLNKRSERLTVVPLTTFRKASIESFPVRFVIPMKESGLEYDSIVMTDKITTIKRSRLIEKVKDKISKNYIDHLKKCLRMSHENSPVITHSLSGR